MSAAAGNGHKPTVLVVGAAGVFGRRYAEGLCRIGGIRIVLVGRNIGKAERLRDELRSRWPEADVVAKAFDRRSASADAISATGARIVVDLAGPFQGSDVSLVQAAIAAGAHYIDIADGRAFVAGIGRLDAAAKAAGVAVVSGASSTPALSHAALDRLTEGWRRIDHVEVAISPGNRAPRGLSVIAAILSWTGQPISVFRGGRRRTEHGWGLTHRRTISGLGRRWLSLAETPDLDLLAERYGPTCDALFFAGVELSVMHLGLAAAAFPVRWRWLASLAPAARLFQRAARLLEPFGSDIGGMAATAQGIDADGLPRRSTYTLVAASGDGPNVPVLAALALTRKLTGGDGPPPGAVPSPGTVTLAEIEAEMAAFDIRTDIATVALEGPGLFRLAIPGFDALPEALRRAHRVEGTRVLSGEASIDGGGNALARLVAACFGFPKAESRVPVEVEIRGVGTPAEPEERWTRRFGRHEMVSHLTLADGGGVEERFGPFAFTIRFRVDEGRLVYETKKVRFLKLPLPAFLASATEAFEAVDAEERFIFDVAIAMPLVGRLVHYRGWLA